MADEVTPDEKSDTGAEQQQEATTATETAETGSEQQSGQTTETTATGDDTASEATSDWPEDWRDRLAKGDEKAMKRLARFASPENLVKTLIEQDKKISSGEYKRGLPENPSEKELADYRKANGIPDEATPENYGISWPEEFEASEADNEELTGFLGKMHERNAPPELVQEAWNYYTEARQKAEQELYDAAQKRTEDYRVELRSEYGKDYKRNTQIGNNFLAQQLGDKAPEFTALTLADGTKLGDHPDFVRFIVNAGLAAADDEALATTELSGGQSIADAYREALDLKFSDPKKYHTQEHQEKLQRLAAAKSKAA